MKLVFCGTPEFAVPSLQAVLDAGHDVQLVLTQPDRPAGRKMELSIPPVKLLALANGLPVLQPEKIKSNAELRAHLEAVRPEAIVVVAYGRIIPPWMLGLPPLGNINVHGSLLPKYRGAAPIQWAVANGERETGVTTMRLDSGLDTGDMLLQRIVPVNPDATSAQLFPQLAAVGSEVLAETLNLLQTGALLGKAQDHSQATLAPILSRDAGRMELNERSALVVYNRWRGFTPWPGAHGIFRGKRFLVHRMSLAGPTGFSPGEISVSDDKLLAAAADGQALCFDEVQLEGKSRLPGYAFAKDYQLKDGERID